MDYVFFFKLFDILGPTILLMVKDSRVMSVVSRATNATFIALILKSVSLVSFNYYRPMAPLESPFTQF